MGRNTPKMSRLVVHAIKNLRDVQGSTSKEILNYIISQQNLTEPSIQRQMYTALKRGLEYGILKRDRGYYSLNTNNFHTLAGTKTTLETKTRKRRMSRKPGQRRRSKRRRTGRMRGKRRSKKRPTSRNVRFAEKKNRTNEELEKEATDPPPLPSPTPVDLTQQKDADKDSSYNKFDEETYENRAKSRERSATRSRTTASTDEDNADD